MKKGLYFSGSVNNIRYNRNCCSNDNTYLASKNYERQTVVKLRQTQSILTQAIRMTEEEYGDIENWGIKLKT